MSQDLSYPGHYLFGGDKPWKPETWTASDDRVRGGKSQSYLETIDNDAAKCSFHGILDITALGGAGFASQRTVRGSDWDLSAYQGLSVKVVNGDGKKYTLTLKDEVLPKRPDGREQSTISWEFDFVANDCREDLFIPWAEFKPTYRGKPKPEAKPISLAHIKSISIMMRSFFGEQQGPFRLDLDYISASHGNGHSTPCNRRSATPDSALEKNVVKSERSSSWRDWLCSPFTRDQI